MTRKAPTKDVSTDSGNANRANNAETPVKRKEKPLPSLPKPLPKLYTKENSPDLNRVNLRSVTKTTEKTMLVGQALPKKVKLETRITYQSAPIHDRNSTGHD